MSTIKQLPQRELRNNISRVLRAVEQGDTFRVTVHGHPVADLVPVRESGPKTFVPKEELIELFQRVQVSKENALELMEDVRRDPNDVPVDPWSDPRNK